MSLDEILAIVLKKCTFELSPILCHLFQVPSIVECFPMAGKQRTQKALLNKLLSYTIPPQLCTCVKNFPSDRLIILAVNGPKYNSHYNTVHAI